jgi:hypothetical protein
MRQELVWELDGREVWREGPVNAVAAAFVPRRSGGRIWLDPVRLEFNARPENIYLRMLQAAGIPGVISAERDPHAVVRVNLDSRQVSRFVPLGLAPAGWGRTGAGVPAAPGVAERIFVARIVNTLQGSTGVQGVKILIDGTERRSLGSVDISRPLQFDTGVLKPGLSESGP